jgi:predicted nucleic acid-binding protein
VPEDFVVNASPLITLARAGHLNLLGELAGDVWVPEAVALEILAGPRDSAGTALIAGFGLRRDVQVPAAVAEWGLGRGESAVLALALELPGTAILDDRSARRCAAALGISVLGTLGVIALAKRKGVIPAAEPVLRAVLGAGLYYDEASLEALLRGLGESWRRG